MSRLTTSQFPTIAQVVENTVDSMTQGLETTVKASLDIQQALVESTLSVIRAGFGANRLAVEQWVTFTRQQRPNLLGILENSVQTWASAAERTVVAAEQVTGQAVDRVTAEAERVADEAEAAASRREHGRVEARRLEQQHQPRERADEPEPAAPPAINVVKREDDWAVVSDNASRASATFDTKREAVKRARELAERTGADVHVETAKGGQPERNGVG